MRKRIVTMLIALCLTAGMLAGCGGNAASSTAAESSNPTSAAAPSQEPVKAAESEQEAESSTAAEPQESQLEEKTDFQLAESVELPITDELTTFSMWCGAPPGGLSVVGSPIMEYITEKTNISL